MLVGYPPFYADNPFGIYEKILNAKFDWPRLVDPVAKDLVKKLLVPDRTKRLGNMKNGIDDIRRHRWFKHLDWNDVYHRRITVRNLFRSNAGIAHNHIKGAKINFLLILFVICWGNCSHQLYQR